MFDSILNKFDFLLNTEKRIEKITREFEVALSSADHRQALLLYGKGFSLLLDKERYNLLADFIRALLPQLPPSSQLPDNLSSESILQASKALNGDGHLSEAIMLLEAYGFEKEYMDLLAQKRLVLLSNQEDAKIIQEQIRNSIDNWLIQKDYIKAMEWSSLINDRQSLQNTILTEGRNFYIEQLTNATEVNCINETNKKHALLEELAGNYEIAGKIALENLKDNEWASRLYEKAQNYRLAIASLPPENQLRRAELQEKGGNTLTAAQIYESLGKYDKASQLFEQLQNYSKAAECYAKTTSIDLLELAQLYEKANQLEQAIATYLKINTIQSLDMAKKLVHGRGLEETESQIEEHLASLVHGSLEEIQKCVLKAGNTISDTYSSCLGIDFGTTNSVGALYNKKTGQTEVIPVPDHAGSYLEPSFFALDENSKPIFGEEAKKQAITNPQSTVSRVKRSFGKNYNTYNISGKFFKGEQIAAMIINKIKENAEDYILDQEKQLFLEYIREKQINYPDSKLIEIFNANKKTIKFTNVVLTVPAFYNDNQKRSTRDAAEVAGLTVKRLLHEPTAAALAYFYRKNFTHDINVTVIDFGGGTLDISLLEIANATKTSKSYHVQDVQGNIQLGGSDIDNVLLNHVCQEIKDRYGIDFASKHDEVSLSRLRDACETLKINLTTSDKQTMVLHNLGNIQSFEFTLSRSELETVAKGILEKFKRALASCKATEYYILVGNACKMPAIQNIVREMWPNSQELQGLDAGSIVAEGAALEGAVLLQDVQDALILDIVPYSLGISIQHDNKNTISTLIPRQTTIPCIKSDSYTTTTDNQTVVGIKIYQGESSDPDKNYFLGNFELIGIKPAPAGTPHIEVTFDIGADCILTVTAKDQDTGNQQSIKVDGAAALSSSEKTKLKNYFQGIKETNVIEQSFNELKAEINIVRQSFDDTIRRITQESDYFNQFFQERIENHHTLYSSPNDITSSIQSMYRDKDNIPRECQQFQDQFASAYRSLEILASTRINYENLNSKDNQHRKDDLSKGINDLKNIVSKINDNILAKLLEWNNILRSFKPIYNDMDPVSSLRTSILSNDEATAIKYVQQLELEQKEITEEIFNLLLRYYRKIGRREKYREMHLKYGQRFGLIYPDFNHLNTFVSAVRNSIVLIIVHHQYSGTGFAIGKHLIVTNRHVVTVFDKSDIQIICDNRRILTVESMEIDNNPAETHDLAVLHVSEDITPLRLGEFNFVEPGEQVIAIGFPRLDATSNLFDDNLHISKGLVNSIRTPFQTPERVIYFDALINRGNSGGPLFNELGEVIGINTMTLAQKDPQKNDSPMDKCQNIALSTKTLEKYLI